MALNEDDPYALSRPLEIQAILNGMLSKRVLVRLGIPHHTVSIISTLLDIDKKSGVVLLDNASDEAINNRLLKAPSVRLQGMLDRIMIEFSGPLTLSHHQGRPAFSMALPRELRRMQRREFFRMDIPPSSPAACVINDASLPAKRARLRILDLSAGGMRLADADQCLDQVPAGTIFGSCTLELPQSDSVGISARLLRHNQLLQENGRTLHTAAFRFFNLPGNRQIAIQNYVSSLERAVMARRWGIE
ncbi:Flagellar brake protein YcgR OS=Castellaniella defragrans OX=75697 GN=ycgR PE=3 SV=1 [Castellaniella defragrans]